MEFLIEAIFGIILEVIGEIIGYIFFELLCRGAIKILEAFFEIEYKYFLPICAILGIGFGALSVHIFPDYVIRPSKIYGVNLIVSPLITGLLVHIFSLIRKKKEKTVYMFESFSYGFLFAFCFVAMRFILMR